MRDGSRWFAMVLCEQQCDLNSGRPLPGTRGRASPPLATVGTAGQSLVVCRLGRVWGWLGTHDQLMLLPVFSGGRAR